MVSEMTVFADVTQISDEALWCRTERHLWLWERDTPVVDEGGRMIAFIRHSTCDRCTATREQEISMTTWSVVKGKIHYPKGYLVTGGRLARPDIYREQFERPARRRAIERSMDR